MRLGDIDNTEVSRAVVSKYFPNLAALHPDTKFWAYREFNPMRDKVEITIFYREPDRRKMRLDAEAEGSHLESADELRPEDIRMVMLVDATSVMI